MNRTAATSARRAQRLIEGVQAEGVPHIFGRSGGKIDHGYDALDDRGVALIVSGRQSNAALVAGALGRVTGVPGVVLEPRS
jgi:acetolactate synthase I/II/III large subunit